jgi:hypothetical protein
MIIFIGLVALGIIGYLLHKKSRPYSGVETLSQFLVAVAIGGVVLTAIILPINYNETKAEVAKYYALKQSLENARVEGASDIERAAVVKEIIEFNSMLANAKYWNETTFDIFIADELAELKPLR